MDLKNKSLRVLNFQEKLRKGRRKAFSPQKSVHLGCPMSNDQSHNRNSSNNITIYGLVDYIYYMYFHMYFHMHKIITSKKGSNEFEKNEEKCMGRFEEREREWRKVIIISKKRKYFILI